MSFSIGFDDKWNRDIGYGVPATCDHPECDEFITRGLGYACGEDPSGAEKNKGCGLYFCDDHLLYDHRFLQLCEHCIAGEGETFVPSPDVQEWVDHKLTHQSWADWRESNPDWVAANKRSDKATNDGGKA